MVRLGKSGNDGDGDGDKDSYNKGDGDGDDKKGRPTTPLSIAEVGDGNGTEEATPIIISSIFSARFQQEVGDPPSELVITPLATSSGSVTGVRPQSTDVEAAADTAGEADGVDSSRLGAAAPAPTPSPQLRRQPTPDEAARYAEVARQLNEVARQIEADYSDELDQLVDSLNLVSEVAYDAFAAVARTIISKGITFSRILVLILFGWRVLKKIHSSGILGIFQRILEYFLKFITDNVLAWVCEHGGWTHLLRTSTTADDGGISQDVFSNLSTGQALGLAAAFGACAVAAYLLLGNRRS